MRPAPANEMIRRPCGARCLSIARMKQVRLLAMAARGGRTLLSRFSRTCAASVGVKPDYCDNSHSPPCIARIMFGIVVRGADAPQAQERLL